MNDWHAFGGELRRLRLQRNRTLRGLARSIRYDVGALSRIENGVRKPALRLVHELDAELDAGGALVRLATECDASAPDGITAAATESLAFADWASDDRAGQLSIDGVHYEIARIAICYVHAPPQPLFTDLMLLRDQVWQSLRCGPTPARARDLMFLGGVAVALLAQLSGNLGGSIAAMQHALAAERLARRAEHLPLLAWVAGTKALIAEWSGNPSRALDFARQGAVTAPAGEQSVRLAALEARCAARLGRFADARAAITRAEREAERPAAPDEVTGFGGVLRFPATKAAYYAGTTYRLLGAHADAERWAGQAIAAYASGPSDERSYGDEALARVDVAMARIGRHAVEEAGEILRPVLDLPAEQRIHPVAASMRQVGEHLDTRSAAARALRDEIAAFRTAEPPAP
ncbi:helix-turn-helix domain-containing protein [Nocardia terpenica]|uniref:helix-turn-helix domain-containing protein n=1 Tax=Nocardia terpenica TaxID=455432 RepID=UPI001894B900|nr:helix-turn-helix domain-containing protein [Nocardia terpenica]MBF6064036.1 helix-turn-helix domain-containing protein [Nocardia terpenica]MBF6107728.1 helix-turn-helix domain-containing protein [Nocardia terpenica]MBF6114796.1 helix-turn-helix domain-containing protein [Nocardia terpenica]MBF6121217.1 helix-turn-helix domain-containing protein [Nocardia terpenica]MBF6153241.1 helix-turn-helix domain-containing protein [Nocardia terpenica]